MTSSNTNWYAIRTKPGSQTYHRELWVEKFERRDGYRITSAADPGITRLEHDLAAHGFVYYMPAEFVASRHRRKTGLCDVRRFPLIKGYAFVSEIAPRDWSRLVEIDTVDSIVTTSEGNPVVIDRLDIHRLRMFEADSKARAQYQADLLAVRNRRAEKQSSKVSARSARKKLFRDRKAKVIWGDHVGREATVLAWQGEAHVRALVKSLDEAAGENLEQIVVPYQFLKAAE